MSGLSLPVSKFLILPFGLLAVVGIFCNCPGEVSVRQKTAERIVSLVIPFVIAVIICTDMLMHYTYNTRPVIDGVQGRYFLPLLPIGFSAFHTEKLRWKPDLNKFVIVALCALQLAVICRIMFYTIRFVV